MHAAVLPSLACAGCLLLAAQTCSTPARAESPPLIRTLKVEFADLDPNRPQDRVRLQRRIEHAARLVCEPGASTWEDHAALTDYQNCHRRAVAQALSRIRMLTAARAPTQASTRSR